MKFFIPVFQNITMAKVSCSAADAQANGYLGGRDRIVFNRDHLVGEAKKEVFKMVSDGYTPPLKEKIQVPGETAQEATAAQLSEMRAGKQISEYDAYLGNRIAYVLSGGDVAYGTFINEEVILNLEANVFIDLLKENKTLERIEHMLNTGKPLRN